MLLEALQRFELIHRDEFSIHEKHGISMVTRPACHLGVVSLASTDQVGKELDGGIHRHGLKLRGHGSE